MDPVVLDCTWRRCTSAHTACKSASYRALPPAQHALSNHSDLLEEHLMSVPKVPALKKNTKLYFKNKEPLSNLSSSRKRAL